MITCIATLKVKAGKMDEAMKVLKEIVPKIKEAEKGLLSYVPHTVKGEKNKNTIVFYEKYESEDAFKLHAKNLPKSLAKLMPLLEPGMDIKSCNEIV